MVCKSHLDTPISSSILALVLLLVHGMQSMCLQHHISKAAILLRSALFRVQVSEAYKAIGKNEGLVKPDFGCSSNFVCQPRSWYRLVLDERAIAMRCLVSWLQLPSVVIRDPMKLNLETDSISLPSIMRGSSTLKPRSSLSTLTLFKKELSFICHTSYN